MANHKSAKKCIRKTIRQTMVNKARVTRYRTFVKKAESALENASANADSLFDVVRAAESELMKAVSKGVLHKKTASRKISRMVKKAKAQKA